MLPDPENVDTAVKTSRIGAVMHVCYVIFTCGKFPLSLIYNSLRRDPARTSVLPDPENMDSRCNLVAI